jgi:hypothetical protein
MRTVEVKHNTETDEHYLDLKEILKGSNTSLEDVAYYELEEKDGIITLKLYDKDKEQLKVKLCA